MLTSWGTELLKYNVGSSYLPTLSIVNNSKASVLAKTIAGNTIYVSPYVDASNPTGLITSVVESGSTATNGIAVGSDDTPPTENDYSLGSIITGLAGSGNRNTVYDTESGKYIAKIIMTITNNGSADIVIKEVGYFIRMLGSNSMGGTTSTSMRRSIMIDRTLLDEAVVIPAGDAGLVQYEFVYG